MALETVLLKNLLKTDFKLFDFDYDFDDRAFASELEQAVIDHYYMYEIGQATPDDFKRVFKNLWLSAMSYYNQMHNTTLLSYEPLINYKMSEALEQLSQSNRKQDTLTDGTTQNTSTDSYSEDLGSTSEEDTTQNNTNTNTRTDNTKSENESSDTTSDYPQQSIAGGDYLSGQRLSDSTTENTGTVEDDGTTTSISNSIIEGSTQTEGQRTRIDQGTSNTTGTIEDTGTDNTTYEKTIEGITGTTYQDLIMKERNNIIRIKGMLIEELKPCFLLVYN